MYIYYLCKYYYIKLFISKKNLTQLIMKDEANIVTIYKKLFVDKF